jgi:hypothetical protein
VIAEGTPEEVARVEDSHTGRYIKRLLASNKSKSQPSQAKTKATV